MGSQRLVGRARQGIETPIPEISDYSRCSFAGSAPAASTDSSRTAYPGACPEASDHSHVPRRRGCPGRAGSPAGVRGAPCGKRGSRRSGQALFPPDSPSRTGNGLGRPAGTSAGWFDQSDARSACWWSKTGFCRSTEVRGPSQIRWLTVGSPITTVHLRNRRTCRDRIPRDPV